MGDVMANYNQMFSNPLTVLGATMMQGFDPNRQGLGGLGMGMLAAGQQVMQNEQLAQRQAMAESEQARAQQMADLQMRLMESKIRQQQMGAGATYSKTPTYFRDSSGNLVIGQLGDTGQLKVTELPEGVTPVKPYSFQNLGGQIAAIPYGQATPTTAMPIGLSPGEQPAVRAAQQAAQLRAKEQAAAQIEIPAAELKAERISNQIDELLSHPGLSSATGITSMIPVVPGTDRADFEARREQLMGGAFLQAFQDLKGGGSITELETQKAQAAITRMNSATSENAFRAAAEDYRQAVTDGLNKLKMRAGEPIEQQTLTQEASGAVVDWSDLPKNNRRGRNRVR